MAKTKIVVGKLTEVKRLASSRYGNPRFELRLGDYQTYRTGVDASVGYEVSNFKIGRMVMLTLTGSRESVIGIRYSG